MCKELASHGFVALRFDFYNKPNNSSEPNIENMSVTQQLDGTKCAIDFIEKLDIVDKDKIGLTGHSLGGMTVVIYTPTDKRVKALVVQSLASTFGNTKSLGRFKTKSAMLKGYVSFIKSWGIMRINYSFYVDGKTHDVLGTAEKIACPTLVFHGDKDVSVPLAHSTELIKHLKLTDKLEIIKGADHCYYENNTMPVVTKLMLDWFNRYLK